MVFLEFRLKFAKFGDICGFPVILTEHFLQDFQCRPLRGGGGGGGRGTIWMFSKETKKGRVNFCLNLHDISGLYHLEPERLTFSALSFLVEQSTLTLVHSMGTGVTEPPPPKKKGFFAIAL